MLTSMRPLRAFPALAAFLLVTTLQAQTYTAAKVHFSDPGTFTQQQLEAAAGIHAGTKLTAADLGTAAQKLVDTGYFDSMDATIDGAIASATILFNDKPTPLSHMLPVGFENFVWLTSDEIMAAIRSKIPMYNGYLLDNSPHQAEVKAALTAALAAKSVSAEVSCEDFEPTLRQPRRAIGCKVARPSVQVANVKLGGVTPDLVPLIQKSVNATARTNYTEGPANETTADLILAPLLDAGYVQAMLTDASPAPSGGDNTAVPVIFSAKLVPGAIFRVSGITFAGTDLLSAESFASTSKLHSGDIASRHELLETLAPLDAAYRRKGYMDVIIHADPTVDMAIHQVAYAVKVEPGEQYRLHETTVNNLDPSAKADYDRGFLMKAGDIYNPEYVATFLQHNTALRALTYYSAWFKAYADPNTHTVDLVINFVRGGGSTSVTAR